MYNNIIEKKIFMHTSVYQDIIIYVLLFIIYIIFVI